MPPQNRDGASGFQSILLWFGYSGPTLPCSARKVYVQSLHVVPTLSHHGTLLAAHAVFSYDPEL